MRLNAATNSVVSFLDYGLSRAERRQQMVEITISKADDSIEMRSSEQGFFRKLQMPEGVSIVQVFFPQLPEQSADDANLKRNFLLYPSGTVPADGLAIDHRRNVQRVVRASTRSPESHAWRRRRRPMKRANSLVELLVATLMAIAVAGLMGAVSHFSAQRRAAHRSRPRRSAGPSKDRRAADRQRSRKGPVRRNVGPEATGGGTMGWRARLTPFEIPKGGGVGQPFVERVELEDLVAERGPAPLVSAGGLHRSLLTRADLAVAGDQTLGPLRSAQ